MTSKLALLFDSYLNLVSRLSKSHRYIIITDTIVENLYGKKLEKELLDKGLRVELISFEATEENKSRKTKELVEDALLSLKCGKDTTILSLGGGIVSDLAGFIAATYARGIPYINIPTTLLAMVDASIGGKTAVNTAFGKNLIGAFYNPSFILLDFELLQTLPKKGLKNGYTEIIKYALIVSKPLFKQLEKRNYLIQDLVEKSIVIKSRITRLDCFETGLRRILNFGHTVGHALEKVTNYAISHGEAVAIGMAFESFLSMKMSILSKKDYEKIIDLLKAYSYDLKVNKNISYENFISAMSMDKKSISSKPRFVLLSQIGKVESFDNSYCKEVEETLIKEAYEHFSNYAQ